MCQISSASPTQPRGVQRIDLVAGARELEDAEHRHEAVEELDFVVLDQRVGEQALAHRVKLRRVLHVELDQPSDVDARRAGEPERGQRPLDGRALGVEDARLGTDQHARPHESASGPLQPRLKRLAGDPLVRLDVTRARARDDIVGNRGGGRALVPAAPDAQSRTYCLSKLGWPRPGS